MKFRKSTFMKLSKYISILLIIITTAIVSLNFSKQKTIVLFAGLSNYIDYRVDLKTKLFLKKSKYYNFKKSHNNLSSGSHIIHYDTSPVTRYYSKIDVEKGRNIIKPVFEYHSLPSLSIYRAYVKKSVNRIKNTKKFNYITYKKNGTTKKNLLNIELNQEIKKSKGTYHYAFGWDVILNGKLVSGNKLSKPDTNISNKTNFKQILYKDTTHQYYVECFFKDGVAKLKIWAEYI